MFAATRSILLAVFLSLVVPFAIGGDAGSSSIRLRSTLVTRPAATPIMPQGGAALIRFDGVLQPGVGAAADDLGIRLVAPLAADAWLAWLPPGGVRRARQLPGFSWLAPYEWKAKIAPEFAGALPDDTGQPILISIDLIGHADVAGLSARLEELGLRVEGAGGGSPAVGGVSERRARITALATAPVLAATREIIARWPEVLWIGRRPYYGLLNQSTIWVGQSGLEQDAVTPNMENTAQPVFENGLRGEGQIISILDTGLDADSAFFYDEALGLPPVVEGTGTGVPDLAQRKVIIVDFLWDQDDPDNVEDWGDHPHGTEVAGAALGDLAITPGGFDAGDGMAPMAKLIVQDGGYGNDSCSDIPAVGCPAVDLKPYYRQAYDQGSRISTNSWGDREDPTGFPWVRNIYSTGSEDVDTVMWEHPDMLIVFAAGNSGIWDDESLISPGTAKNILTVGATGRGLSAWQVPDWSSQGPAEDGRLKPDVVIPGKDVETAMGDGDITTFNSHTSQVSGTSLATPAAGGFAALVREYFVKGYYPTGVPVAEDEFTPSAALLKATLVNSAAPVSASPPVPATDQGWGRILLDDALYFPGDPRRLYLVDETTGFAASGDPADDITFTVQFPEEMLKLTLAWTDYPSFPAAATNLVNDLDLELEAPDGTLYRGNVITGGLSQPGGSADRVNNLEAIRIASPQPGLWTARVRPYAITVPTQHYALVVNGGLPAPGIVLDRVSLSADDGIGGDGDGILEPGESDDLPLALRNSGDTPATHVRAHVESLLPSVRVLQGESFCADLDPGAQADCGPAHLRIQIATDHPCTDPVSLRLSYLAERASRSEELELPTGTEQVFLSDDFEGTTTWQHVASESTAVAGDWIIDDPIGTPHQAEDDATIDPGSFCLFTGQNNGNEDGTIDVDEGIVVARSGAYDLSAHPEAHLRLSRWWGLRYQNRSPQDYFEVAIRENSAAEDQQLERLGMETTVPRWTEVGFRVADFVTPGPEVELKVAASDDSDSISHTTEAAIDEIIFWDPLCDDFIPAPLPVLDLGVAAVGGDLLLSWSRPPGDSWHGRPDRYRIYRSETVQGGYALLEELSGLGESLAWTDDGAGSVTPAFFTYEVIAATAAGDADALP